MRITIEVDSEEEYSLVLKKYMPVLGELGESSVEVLFEIQDEKKKVMTSADFEHLMDKLDMEFWRKY
jgi:hypothetical protein